MRLSLTEAAERRETTEEVQHMNVETLETQVESEFGMLKGA